MLKNENAREVEELCRQLPQVGRFLESVGGHQLLRAWNRELVRDAARRVLVRIREELRSGAPGEAKGDVGGAVAETVGGGILAGERLAAHLEKLAELVGEELRAMTRPSLRRVINATGVILQTNLGRAPLSKAAIRNIGEVARGYCNLELDLESGERGRRDDHVEELILRVLALRSGLPLDDKGAAVVNNCAAATFLALNSLADGGEVIVSRGELVEIGGGFRIPEILRKSGAALREVGTTNRTRLSDYAAAITPETRLILRVHRSNFSMEGFTEQPSLAELVALGAEAAVPVFEDQGTGCAVRLEDYGIEEQSNWGRSASSGASLVAASGDKLLGGPQCGILVGKRNLIERLRANPLARVLRVDKLTYAALEATLLAYVMGQEESVPAISMLRTGAEEIRRRCEALVSNLRQSGLDAETVATRSVIGGGTTPGASLPSFAVALRHAEMGEEELAAALRRLDPPVMARTRQGRVLLDLRTVASEDDAVIAEVISQRAGDEERT